MLALTLYAHAAAVTEGAGILLADTKFEFGIDPETGAILLIDEVLTPGFVPVLGCFLL